MAHQTPLKEPLEEEVVRSNRAEQAPVTVLAHSFGECARDIVNLTELQGQLLLVDLKQNAGALGLPLTIVALGVALLLACWPVLLMALAYALVEGAGWSHWLSFLVAGLVGLVVGGALAAGGLAFLRSAMPGLERSRQEFRDNVQWLKETLSSGGHPRPRRSGE